MTLPLHGISSMATRQVLAELAQAYERRSGRAVMFEAVGGVDAARRVQAGESFDWVALAADAIDRLSASGRLQPHSRVDLMHSPVAMAVRAGAPRPDVSSESALRQAVLASRSLCTSTGPSGTYLTRLFESWGVAEQIQGRLVTAPPGVPVATLVARGEVELGFQQLSELMHESGIDVLGTLPAPIAFVTTFSAGIGAGTTQTEAVREWLLFLASPLATAAKRRHGMEAV